MMKSAFKGSRYASAGFAAIMLAFGTAPVLLSLPAQAAVVGSMAPPESLSADRIKALPAAEQPAWLAYIKASDAQRVADKAALAAERVGLTAIPSPARDGDGEKTMPLNESVAFYASAPARHVADVIVSFQTPAGGWGKNQPRDGELRQKGQGYVAHDGRGSMAGTDPNAEDWSYVGTVDNGATLTEIRFLARVAAQAPGKTGDAYRVSLKRGVEYLIRMQYPNGGWPQVWPLDGGYHDAITFNDDALMDTVRLLTEVTQKPEYAFLEAGVRAKAAQAVERGLKLVLKVQYRIDGKPSIWGQQHDVITEAPCGARNFEPPALSSAESANIMNYLMAIEKPSADVVAAVHGAAAFFKASGLMGYVFVKDEDPALGRKLKPQNGAGPIWSRYYDLKTLKPIFGDRDRTVHDDVNDLTLERRNGYSWFNSSPAKSLSVYEVWARAHPVK
jgi:PelA/Pel-15E family pectate lyase